MHLISQKNSLSGGFQKQRVNFIKRWKLNEVLFYFGPRKNVNVKHIESYKPRESYHADIVFLPNYVWDGFKNIFTILQGRVDPLKIQALAGLGKIQFCLSWTKSHKGSNPEKIHFCLLKSSSGLYSKWRHSIL